MSDKQQEAFDTFEFDLQPIRGFPELRWTGKKSFSSTAYYPAQLKESYGDSINNWLNKIYWGDNLQVMSHLLRQYRGKIKLIYIDPPFDSKADYKKAVVLKGKATQNDHNTFEEKQYTDIWNADGYNQFILDRLVLMRELMTDDGTVFLHCDQHQSHRIRCLMDEVFGPTNFINEIIWVRSTNPKGSQHTSPRLSVFTDTIFCYGKTSSSKLHPDRIRIPLTSTEIEEKYFRSDEKGRFYDGPIVSTSGMGDRPNLVYEYKGYTPPSSGWRLKKERLIELDRAGDLGWTSNGKPFRKLRAGDDKGKPVGNFWNDISLINSQSNERVGYPTQKPEALLKRILTLGTDEGDLVFDCFMGSGTTQIAALKTGRRFLGADINLGAIETTVFRLNSLLDEAKKRPAGLFEEQNAPEGTPGFEVYNVNNYDIFRNPVEAKELIKDAMELQPLPAGSVFDGQRDQYLVKIMPVNRIATRADLNEVINGMDFKAYERRQTEAPSKVIDRIMLVCMGHEPDLGPELVKAAKPYSIEVEVVDLIRDKSNLHFKRQSDANLEIKDGHIEIVGFYPLNLLQKLSMETEAVEDWRQLVETVKIDWNYDGAVLSPELIDTPGKNELVSGRYPIPKDAATIRVKITDLLSESWEGEIENG